VNKGSAVNAGAPSERRTYRSPEREQRARETRARIVTAAESLFLTDGYAATTIRAVAQKAEVAEQTVYLVFKNKPALLDAVIDGAIGGPTGATWRTQLEAALTRPPKELLREFAVATAGVMARTARILAAAEAAAITAPELADSRKQGHAAMRTQFERIAERLHEHRALAAQLRPRDAAAAIYALSNEATYLRLTDGYGWSKHRYGTWLADTLIATLLDPRRK
jgi:TetR/AcrR family transcriptional regulator, regulator of autoinduction and epiphytic fitness